MVPLYIHHMKLCLVKNQFSKTDKREEVEKIAEFKNNEIIRSHNYLLVEQLIEALRGKRYDKDNFEATRCGNDDKLNVIDKLPGDLEKPFEKT
uniref:Uncharacterized protein n=1 Tax=Strongyloides venezuelensis TaxID=75913 RepID=A0A0K0G1B5_STRVS